MEGSAVLTVAIVLVVVALAVFLGAKLAERRNPPIGRKMTVKGVDLHYIDRGEGEPLVFFHGNMTMLQDFLTSGIIDALSSRYRVIAFDRPGFGYSKRPRSRRWTASEQAELFASAMQQLGLARAVVIGHSWGTLVAVALAQARPGRVKSLVLLSGYYYREPRIDVVLAHPPALPVIGDILRYTVSPIFGALLLPLTLRVMFGPPQVPKRFKSKFPLSLMLRPWQIRATSEDGAMMNSEAAHLEKGYASMLMPVEIVAGGEDRIVSAAKHSVKLGNQLAHARVLVVPGKGHMIHHSAPEQVVETIDRAAA